MGTPVTGSNPALYKLYSLHWPSWSVMWIGTPDPGSSPTAVKTLQFVLRELSRCCVPAFRPNGIRTQLRTLSRSLQSCRERFVSVRCEEEKRTIQRRDPSVLLEHDPHS